MPIDWKALGIALALFGLGLALILISVPVDGDLVLAKVDWGARAA